MTRLMILLFLFLLPITHSCSTHMSIPEPEAQITTEIGAPKEAEVEEYSAIPQDVPDVPLPKQNQQLPAPATAMNQQEIDASLEIEKGQDTAVPLQNDEKEVVSKEASTVFLNLAKDNEQHDKANDLLPFF